MNEKQQINLTLLHIGIGVLLAFYPDLSAAYLFLAVFIGLYSVIRNKNQGNEILYIIAYIAGSEVFFRTVAANPFHEFGKYAMLFFTCLGFFYNGFPKTKNPYWIYLLLLIPSVFMSFMYLEDDFRRKIFFEILGPVCMGFLALYTYKRKISASQISVILNLIALPILTSCIYLILKYSHNIDIVSWGNSNYYFSGNYAPNQMATALGLGVFIYLLKITTESGNKKIFYLNVVVLCLIFYRGLLTFSRGGIATGVMVALVLLLSLYVSKKGYHKLKRKVGLSLVMLTAIFILTSYQTDRSLLIRYTNIEILKSDEKIKTRGRYIQIQSDINSFTQNPIVGIGVGKGTENRKTEYNVDVSTHSEITRMLSEHGIFGLLCLLILFFFPLQLYFKDLRNFYLLPFFIFWLLTINHSATRIIAPLFLYVLSLLDIKFEVDENSTVAKSSNQL